MKRLLLLTCLPFIVTSAKAYFIPQTLYSMILNAERIVYGEVISIDSNTFTIKIEFSLTDPDNSLTYEPELLTIQKFQDYACAGRWSNYEKHQRLFLFLHNYKGQLKVMGSGNEGEILILQDSIMISGITLPSCPPDGLNEKQLRNWPNKECFDLRHYKKVS